MNQITNDLLAKKIKDLEVIDPQKLEKAIKASRREKLRSSHLSYRKINNF